MKKPKKSVFFTEEEAKRQAQSYVDSIGEYLYYLERSFLPLKRKVFYQAAILSGYLSEELLSNMLKEMEESTKTFEAETKALEKQVKSDEDGVESLTKQYAEAAKYHRHAYVSFTDQLLQKTEKQVEKVRKTGESAEIQKIKTKLKTHGSSSF